MPEATLEKPDADLPFTPTPEPAPTPAAKPSPEPVKLNDPFADLKPPTAKPAAKAADAKVEPKPGDKPAEGAVPPDKKLAVRKNPLEEQRTRIEQQNGVIAQTTKERDGLRREVESLRTKGGGDTSALTKKIEELNQKNQQLVGEISARDYSKHPDFVAKYQQPFDKAADYGKRVVESLQIADEAGNLRDAKWDTDFAPIYQLPRGAALRQAKAMFGEDVNAIASVMGQYDKLHELQDAKTQALTDWQKGADERDQKERANTLVRQQNITQAFEMVTKKFVEDDAEFQIKPDDAEGKALWDKSQAIVDRAYFGRDKLAPHEQIMLDSAVRLRAINEPILRHRIAKLTEELADYKARFEEKEASTNGKTRKTGTEAATTEDEPWQHELVTKLKAAG